MKKVTMTITEEQLNMICNALCQTQFRLENQKDVEAEKYKELAIELMQISMDLVKGTGDQNELEYSSEENRKGTGGWQSC